MKKTFYCSLVMFLFLAVQSKGQVVANKAYGDNMVQVDVIAGVPVFAIYSGDIDQSGVIDGADFGVYDFDAQLNVQGYFITDLNGDGEVNGSDFGIYDFNAQLREANLLDI